MTNYTSAIREEYSNYLSSQHVSHSTYKNYLSDLTAFCDWTTSNNISDPVSLPAILHYRHHLKSLPLSTANRRLSAIRKLCQLKQPDLVPQIFNISTNPISANPTQSLLSRYAIFLKNRGASPLTIKNYLSDARYFLKLTPDPTSLIGHLSQDTSPTGKRRLSSLKKFLGFLNPQTPTLTPTPTSIPPPPTASPHPVITPPSHFRSPPAPSSKAAPYFIRHLSHWPLIIYLLIFLCSAFLSFIWTTLSLSPPKLVSPTPTAP